DYKVTGVQTCALPIWSSKPVAGGELSTLWLVPRTTPGVRVPTGGFDGLGLRGNDSSPIAAEDARIAATARLGSDGGGFAIMIGRSEERRVGKGGRSRG